MYRKAQSELKAWYKEIDRKPLLVRGARQVGKSTLVRLFAKSLGLQLHEINLKRTPLKVFDRQDIEIKNLIRELEDKTQHEISPKKSLIFLDEIQAQPKAFTYLRYFYEERPDLAIIATGSLLEFYLSDEALSVPVGRIKYFFLGPMEFDEFLLAKKKRILLKRLSSPLELTENQHHQLNDCLKEYFYVGGMPAAVKKHVQGHGLSAVREEHDSILNTYLDDFLKYTKKSEFASVQKVFQYIPFHLGEKIKYSNIDNGVRAYQIQAAMTLLEQARVCLRVTHTNATGLPLSTFVDESVFKVYFLDIGLVLALQKITWSQLTEKYFDLNQRGEMFEQFIAQHLFFRSRGKEFPLLNYWIKDKTSGKAEIDFLFQEGINIYPIEVKAGKTGSLKSLWQFIKERKCTHAVHFSSDLPHKEEASYKFDNDQIVTAHIFHLPHYLVVKMMGLIHGDTWIQKGIVHFAFVFIWAVFLGSPVLAAISHANMQLNLDEAILEKKTIENSLKSRAANQALEVQKSNLEAANARQMPQLSLEGQYRYQTNVPEISMANNLKIKLGENTNYSIGPILSYSLYEGGQISAAINTQNLLAQSKEKELESIKQEEKLQFSIKFLELTLQKEKNKIYYEAFLLAKKQFADIHARFQNGASSKLDEITSEKEKEDQKVRFLQGQTLFNQLLIEILVPAGAMPEMPESVPIQAIDASISSIAVKEELDGIFTPNLIVHLVPKPSSADQSSPPTKSFTQSSIQLSTQLSTQSPTKISGGVSTNPRLKSMQLQQESLIESIKTIDADLMPKVRVFAKSTLEYPKMGTTDSYQQNMVGLNLSWNLFDFSRTQSLVAAQSGTALSQKWSLENYRQGLEIKGQQIEASLVQLKAQKEILTASQAQAKRISELSYQSYLAGKISFSQVQAANLRQQESELNLTLVKHNLEFNRLQLQSLKGEL